MAWKLTKNLLRTSGNDLIKTLVASGFVDKKQLTDPSEVRQDMERNSLLINGKTLVASETDDQLKAQLDANFPGEIDGVPYSTYILSYYSQGILFYALNPLEYALRKSSDNTITCADITKEKNGNSDLLRTSNMYFNPGDKNVYLKLTVPAFEVIDIKTSRKHQIKGSTWTFKLVKDGFEFMEADVYNEYAYNMYLSNNAPTSLQEFSDYPIINRIRDAFHEVYNHESNSFDRDKAAFFGIKVTSKNRYNEVFEKMENYTLAALLSFPKNILKLFTEFLPLAIEKAARKAIQNSQENAGNKYVLGLAAVVFAIAWTFRQIASRLTSPVRGFREAYTAGAQYHRALGVVLATASALLTISTMIAAGFGAAALFTALGIPVVAAAATWVATHTAVIGSFITAATMKVVGASISYGMATVIAGSAITSLIVAGAITLRTGFKALLGKLFERNETARIEIERQNNEAAETTVVSNSHASISDQLNSAASLNLSAVSVSPDPSSALAPPSPRPSAVTAQRKEQNASAADSPFSIFDKKHVPKPPTPVNKEEIVPIRTVRSVPRDLNLK